MRLISSGEAEGPNFHVRLTDLIGTAPSSSRFFPDSHDAPRSLQGAALA